jgi:hypothetical protein
MLLRLNDMVVIKCNICNEEAEVNTTIGDIFKWNITPGELDLQIEIKYLDNLKRPFHVCKSCLMRFIKGALEEKTEGKYLEVESTLYFD